MPELKELGEMVDKKDRLTQAERDVDI